MEGRNTGQQPRRRRSILKRISESFPVVEEPSQPTLTLDHGNNGENIEPIHDFTYQAKRRVSFGSSFIKEFHSTSFEDDGGRQPTLLRLQDPGQRLVVVDGDTRNVTRFMNIDMDLSVPNFDETYVVCGESNKENSPGVHYRQSQDQNATFSVVPKTKLSSLSGDFNPRNWLTSSLGSNGGRILTTQNLDITFPSCVDMDISQCDDVWTRANVERNFLSSTMNPPVQGYQNTTIRLPNIMELSLGEDESQCSRNDGDSGFKSSSLNVTKTFYGGEMSVCRELLYDTGKMPLKENATLNWVLPNMNSSHQEHCSSPSGKGERLQNSTFVVNYPPEILGPAHPPSPLKERNDDIDPISTSQTSSFVECLDDQVEPSLCQSVVETDPSMTQENTSAEDTFPTLNLGINISQKLETFIKRNDAIRGCDRVKYMDEVMEEIINMTPEVYVEFCKVFRRPANSNNNYLEAIEIHRRLRKDIDAMFAAQQR